MSSELVGRRVRVTWDDCCADGEIKGTLERYRHIGGWPDRFYIKIDGVGMLIGGAQIEEL